MRDAMACELGRDRLIEPRRSGRRILVLAAVRPLTDEVDIGQARQHRVGRHPEVDQAGDLTDTDPLQPIDHGEAPLGGAEQAAGLVVPQERELEHRVEIFVVELLEVVVREAVVGGGVRYEGRRLLPDVDEACEEVAGFITPRIGGVGPTTIAMLFRNTVEAAERSAAR